MSTITALYILAKKWITAVFDYLIHERNNSQFFIARKSKQNISSKHLMSNIVALFAFYANSSRDSNAAVSATLHVKTSSMQKNILVT